MNVQRFSNFIIPIVIGILLCIFFVPQTLNCATQTEKGYLVGKACNAEMINVATTQSWQDNHTAIQSKEIILIFLSIVFLAHTLIKPIKHIITNVFWTRLIFLHVLSSRSGPYRVFFPFLHATYGY
jgi:hypothetical protein